MSIKAQCATEFQSPLHEGHIQELHHVVVIVEYHRPILTILVICMHIIASITENASLKLYTKL